MSVVVCHVRGLAFSGPRGLAPTRCAIDACVDSAVDYSAQNDPGDHVDDLVDVHVTAL